MVTLSCACALCLTAAVAPVLAKADGAVYLENVQLKMIDGAYVRTVDEETSGLRFVSYLEKDIYETLENDADYNVSYGMIIAPVDYVTDYAVISEETVFGETNKMYYFGEYQDEYEKMKAVLNLEYGELTDPTEEIAKVLPSGTYKCFKGVISKIHEENYTRGFVGVGYVKAVSKTDGSVDYVFASEEVETQKTSARSIASVAQSALMNNVVADGTIQETVLKKYAQKAIKNVALGEKVYDLDTTDNSIAGTVNDDVADYVISDVEGKNVDVTVNGENCANYTYANGTLTLAKANFETKGVYNISVTTSTGKAVLQTYTATVETVDYAIGHSKEFVNWYKGANASYNGEGVTVALTADIDGVQQGGNFASNSFKGTFDGKGHVISNFKGTYGLIPYLVGTLKNVTMVNMTVTSASSAFLGDKCYGSVINCYFQGQQEGGTNANAKRQTGFYASYADGVGGTPTNVADCITNVVVNVHKKDVTVLTDPMMGYGHTPNIEGSTLKVNPSQINNIYMVYNGMSNTDGFNNGLQKSPYYKDNYFYNTIAEMQAGVKAIPATFNASEWVMYEGMLMTVSAKNYYETKQATTLTVSNTETELTVGTALTVQSNMPWLSATLSVDGETVESNAYTLVGNMLTVTDASLVGKTVTIAFQALAGGCKATQTVEKTFNVVAAQNN